MKTHFRIKEHEYSLNEIAKFVAKMGLLILIFLSIYILTKSVLVSPDDYNYTFVQGSHQTARVDSIPHMIETGKFFYAKWTGRVLPHVLIGLFRNIPEYIYEIVNTCVFVIFIVIIDKILNKKTSYLGILSVFGYLTFSRMFGEKFAWLSGSFNYLWPSTFLALFIYYFYNYFKGDKDFKIGGKIAFCLYAFIAGFMHENTAFVGGSFLGCLCLFKVKDYLKFDKSKKVVIAIIFIMFCLGAFANIFAPGNFNRLDSVETLNKLEFLQNYKDSSKLLVAVAISMIAVILFDNIELFKNENICNIQNWKNMNIKLVKEELLYFILPALIATVPMAVVSYFPPRAFLAYEVMFMIVFSKNITVLIDKLKGYDVIVLVITFVATICVFGKFSPSTLAEINYVIPYKQKVTAQYENASQNGEKNVLVSKFEYTPWIHAGDEINISNFFPEFNYQMPVNRLICDYYGFDELIAMGEDEYLIEIETDIEEIKTYNVLDKKSGDQVMHMEYANSLKYCIPKDKFKDFLLDVRDTDFADRIKSFNVRYIGGKISEDELKLEDIVLY